MKGLKTLSLIIFVCLAMTAVAIADVEINKVEISPEEPNRLNDLECSFNITSDNSFEDINISWYRDGDWFSSDIITNEYENGTVDTVILDAENTHDGEEWICKVHAEDGDGDIKTEERVAEIATADISLEYVEITPENPKTGDNLECSFRATTDVEFETIEINWFNNTESFLTNDITGQYVNDTEHTETLPSTDTKKGETWGCEVLIQDGEAEDSGENEVTIQNTAPVISSISDKKVNVERSFSFDVRVTDPDVDDGVDELTYDLTQRPDGMTINENGRIRWTPTLEQEGEHQVTVRVRDESGEVDTESFEIEVDRQMLAITRLDASCSPTRCYDDIDTEDGGYIERVRPGSTIELEVRVENLWSERNDINDIEIIGILERMGTQNELDVEESIRRLRPGRNERVTLSFDIPYDVDEDTYLLDLSVEGEDDDGTYYYIGLIEIDVEIEKENEKLYFKTASLFPSTVACNRDFSLRTNVKNIGSRDQESAQLVIESGALDIYEHEFFDVDRGYYDDRDTEFQKDFGFSISDDVSPGNYEVEVRAYYEDGSRFEREILTIRVNECETPTPTPPANDVDEEDEEEEVEVIEQPGTQQPIGQPSPVTAQPVTDEPFFESDAFLYVLVAAFVVLAFMVVLLAVIAFKK